MICLQLDRIFSDWITIRSLYTIKLHFGAVHFITIRQVHWNRFLINIKRYQWVRDQIFANHFQLLSTDLIMAVTTLNSLLALSRPDQELRVNQKTIFSITVIGMRFYNLFIDLHATGFSRNVCTGLSENLTVIQLIYLVKHLQFYKIK